MRFRSLKASIAWSMLTIAVILMGIAGIVIYLSVKARIYDQLDHALTDKLRFLEAACIQKGKLTSFTMSAAPFQTMHDPDDHEFFQYRFCTGKNIMRSKSLRGGDLPFIGVRQSTPITANVDLPSGLPGRCAGVSFYPKRRSGDEPLPHVNVVVAHDRMQVLETLAELRAMLFLTSATVLVALLGATWFATRRNLRPLDDLSDQIAEAPVGEPGHHFDLAHTPEELSPVVDRLNSLVERVDVAIDYERQFASNAAHELRTPLAAMRGKLELALNRDRTKEEYREAIQAALEAESGLEGVVENLLWLARLESGQQRLEFSEIDLRNDLRGLWTPHFDKAEAKELRVSWRLGEQAAPLRSSADLTRVVVRNLFENAVEYCPEGGDIEIGLTPNDNGSQGFLIDIANTNPGVTSGSLEGIFERYHRGESPPSRSREAKNHVGIGLALCRRIVEVLDGEIAVDLDDEKGLIHFKVKLHASGPN